MRINEVAPGMLAEGVNKLGASLIRYLIELYSNEGKAVAYVEDDLVDPPNFYGRTKFACERTMAASGEN